MNQTIFQFFHWYTPNDGTLWNHVKDEAERLASLGVTNVWLPPAYKSAKGTDEPGYAVYDLFDLGEFDQKGTVRTKYGTKDEYLASIRALGEKGIGVLADIVLNHKMGGDEVEEVPVQKVNDENREEVVSEVHTVRAHTKFTFPVRNGQYSTYIWDWHSFTGICEDGSIHALLNEYGHGSWEPMLENENGNFDYLMGNDIEFRNPNVRAELKYWGKWYVETTGISGFRLDALKHIVADFYPDWLDYLKNEFKRDFFTIGEYWKNDLAPLVKYVEVTEGRVKLFDVPLHYNFYKASKDGQEYDLSTILDNTLVKERPDHAITFVDNHDTQPLQALESTVDYWFKPHAYAIILLREQGIPCVFYPAVYGATYIDHKDGAEIPIELATIPVVEPMMKIRRDLAFGPQRDYFDHGSTVGWTKEGEEDKPNSGYAVLICNGDDGEKGMSLGVKNAGRTFVDACGRRGEVITLDEHGEAVFKVSAGSVSVWVDQQYQL